MINKGSRNANRERRHGRLRNRVAGTADRPRLSVFRSLKHVYAQVIDDRSGATLAAASTLDKDLVGQSASRTDRAKAVGVLVASRAKTKGIATVAFDRGGYRYHGVVAALAQGARSAGLDF